MMRRTLLLSLAIASVSAAVSSANPGGDEKENPFGACHCDDELWIAEDCKSGYICDGQVPSGGFEVTVQSECSSGDNFLVINETSNAIECTADAELCGGGHPDGYGCPPIYCEPALNPFGECECNNQLFIGNDCTEGFLCNSEIDSFLFDGCIKKCQQNQILLPVPESNQWVCVDSTGPNAYTCPNDFVVRCPENPSTGSDGVLDKNDCGCEAELIVAPECREAFFCYDRFQPEGGLGRVCPEGEVIEIEIRYFTWDCVPDVGQCSGNFGGYSFGCFNDTLPEPPQECQYTDNQLGTCDCNGQLMVSDDCRSAFYCSVFAQAEGMDGCLKECAEGQIIDINSENSGTWECKDMTEDDFCPGAFTLDCNSDELDAQCGCEGQFWLNYDCTEAFVCSGAQDPDTGLNEGTPLYCPAGQLISPDLADPVSSQCVNASVTQCAYGGLHFGCPAVDEGNVQCTPSKNPFGPCDCSGQLYISNDCHEGFFCSTDDVPDPFLYDGCYGTCPQGQMLAPDYAAKSWKCVDESEMTCPGEYNIVCEDVGSDFDKDVCECDGQMWVSGDCKEAFLCNKLYPNGGIRGDCRGRPDEIVSFDTVFADGIFSCQPDEGECPGLGGVIVGCDSTPPLPPVPMPECQMTLNPYGECGCSQQIFVNDDCSESFYCLDDPDANADGCFIECTDNQVVYLDIAERKWECADRASDYACSGRLQTDCQDESEPFDQMNCGCDGEIWVSATCQQGFECRGAYDLGNPGNLVTCPAGELFYLDLATKEFECRPEAEVTCLGAFHVGCGVDGGGGGGSGGGRAAASAFVVIGLFAISSIL